MTLQKAVKEADLVEHGVAKAVIGKKKFAIVRKGGKFYGIDGVCTHEGGPLGEGTLREGKFVSPWHGAGYHPEGGTADPETDWVQDTKPFTAKVEGGYVWIDVE